MKQLLSVDTLFLSCSFLGNAFGLFSRDEYTMNMATSVAFCEDREWSSEEQSKINDLKKATDVAYTDDQTESAFDALGLKNSTCQTNPKALWVLGPSASGKSTVTSILKERLGIPKTASGQDDAVLIDGDVVREYHKGYQDLISFGQSHNCIFKKAWPIVQPHLKKAKAALLKRATDPSCQLNVLVPETCTKWARCRKDMGRLLTQNYTISVAGIFGIRSEILERGQKRAIKSGKAYSDKQFVHALAAFVPVMAMGNGQCILVNNTRLPPQISINEPCPSQKVFLPSSLPAWMEEVEVRVIKGASISKEEYDSVKELMSIPTSGGSSPADNDDKDNDNDGFKFPWMLFCLLGVIVVLAGLACMLRRPKQVARLSRIELQVV